MANLKNRLHRLLRWSEKYTKTDMVYLARGGFWMNLNYFVVSLLSFGLSVLFARFLTKETYGTYQIILSFGSILGALTLTGMNSAITNAVARGNEGVLKESIPVQLKYNTVALIAAASVALYYVTHGNTSLAFGILIVGLLTPIFNTFNSYTAYVGGKKDFEGGFLFSMGLNIPYVLFMALGLLFIQNPVLLVLLNLGTNTLATVILYMIALRKYRPGDKSDPSAISYGKHLSLASFFGTVVGHIDNILVFHYAGAAALATYAFASTMPERLINVVQSVTVMAYPNLANRSRHELRQTIFAKSFRLAILTLFMVVLYVLIAPFVFKFFFPKYLDSILYSQGYAFAFLFSLLPLMPFTALAAMRATKEIYIYNILNPIVTVLTMVSMIIYFGIWGLIAARGIAGIVNYGISLALMKYTARHD